MPAESIFTIILLALAWTCGCLMGIGYAMNRSQIFMKYFARSVLEEMKREFGEEVAHRVFSTALLRLRFALPFLNRLVP